jgi:Capsular polysaccharide synthesis protein
MKLNPPWLKGIEWRRLTARDAAWLAQFLARSMWQSAFGVRPFVKQASAATAASDADALPKRIWILWTQGWDSAPELVRLCRSSWQSRNPGWEVVSLDRDSAEALTGAASCFAGRTPTVQAMSNAVRLALLRKHGGVWVDATAYCLKPLDQWLPPMMGSGFLSLARPNRHLLSNSWFLVAVPGHYLVSAWEARYRRFWRLMRVHHRYWVLSFLFTDLLRWDRKAAALWARTPANCADGPHGVARSWRGGDLAPLFVEARAAGVPLMKLNWRFPLSERAAALLGEDIERLASGSEASVEIGQPTQSLGVEAVEAARGPAVS